MNFTIIIINDRRMTTEESAIKDFSKLLLLFTFIFNSDRDIL
jgi:hypothetical protein